MDRNNHDMEHLVPLTIEVPLISRESFEELAADLRTLGFQATYSAGDEERQRFIVWEIVLRVWDFIDEPTAGAVVAAVVAWVRRRTQRDRRIPGTVKLYAPDGSLLKEIKVDHE
jgi:hypothetical protein